MIRWVQCEFSASVLQYEAAIFRDDAGAEAVAGGIFGCAEATEVAVDEGYGVAGWVRYGKIDCVAGLMSWGREGGGGGG